MDNEDATGPTYIHSFADQVVQLKTIFRRGRVKWTLCSRAECIVGTHVHS
jgi:hypothetical protein